MQPAPVPPLQLGHQAAHALLVGANLAEITDLALPAILRHGYGMTRLGHIESDKNVRILLHGSSSRAEDRPAHAGNPRSPAQCRTSHPTHTADMRSYGWRAPDLPHSEHQGIVSAGRSCAASEAPA